MSQRFLRAANIGAVAAAVSVGFFAFASSAFAAASIESLKLTGPNTITIVYSQPVYTSPGDYSGFSGSYAGNSVTSVSGSGTNTITLALANSESSGATGYITIGTNVQDTNDSQYFGGSTWNIVSSIGPAITSFGMSSNEINGSFAGTNDTVTANFNTNEQVNVLNMTIAGHSVSVSGGGTGPYTASYTMTSGDTQQSVPVVATLEDNANNQTTVSFSYSGNGSTVVSTNGNSIVSSIVSNANTTGSLTSGDSITFTLTPTVAEPNARIIGSYNGVPLSWATTNNGVNYVATYIVEAGQGSQTVPLQISGVTLTDQNGNTSAPASGYDIQKTISVTGASTPVTTTTGTTTDVSAEIQSLESQLAALQSQVNSGTTTGTTTATAGTMPAQYTFTEFLDVGSQDAEVTALQQWLTYDGVYSGPITGFYGTLTQTAVEKFQSAHGIDVKGYVGPSTRAALNTAE
jgi:hypothetical protein